MKIDKRSAIFIIALIFVVLYSLYVISRSPILTHDEAHLPLERVQFIRDMIHGRLDQFYKIRLFRFELQHIGLIYSILSAISVELLGFSSFTIRLPYVLFALIMFIFSFKFLRMYYSYWYSIFGSIISFLLFTLYPVYSIGHISAWAFGAISIYYFFKFINYNNDNDLLISMVFLSLATIEAIYSPILLIVYLIAFLRKYEKNIRKKIIPEIIIVFSAALYAIFNFLFLKFYVFVETFDKFYLFILISILFWALLYLIFGHDKFLKKIIYMLVPIFVFLIEHGSILSYAVNDVELNSALFSFHLNLNYTYILCDSYYFTPMLILMAIIVLINKFILNDENNFHYFISFLSILIISVMLGKGMLWDSSSIWIPERFIRWWMLTNIKIPYIMLSLIFIALYSIGVSNIKNKIPFLFLYLVVISLFPLTYYNVVYKIMLIILIILSLYLSSTKMGIVTIFPIILFNLLWSLAMFPQYTDYQYFLILSPFAASSIIYLISSTRTRLIKIVMISLTFFIFVNSFNITNGYSMIERYIAYQYGNSHTFGSTMIQDKTPFENPTIYSNSKDIFCSNGFCNIPERRSISYKKLNNVLYYYRPEYIITLHGIKNNDGLIYNYLNTKKCLSKVDEYGSRVYFILGFPPKLKTSYLYTNLYKINNMCLPKLNYSLHFSHQKNDGVDTKPLNISRYFNCRYDKYPFYIWSDDFSELDQSGFYGVKEISGIKFYIEYPKKIRTAVCGKSYKNLYNVGYDYIYTPHIIYPREYLVGWHGETPGEIYKNTETIQINSNVHNLYILFSMYPELNNKTIYSMLSSYPHEDNMTLIKNVLCIKRNGYREIYKSDKICMHILKVSFNNLTYLNSIQIKKKPEDGIVIFSISSD